MLYCFGDVFCNVFQTPLLPTFWSQRNPRAPIWSPIGKQSDHNRNKSAKVKTALPLERGHQNQAFQGLCFTMIHHLSMCVVGTCNVQPSSDAFFILCSSYGPTWPPFWSLIWNTVQFIFLMTFSSNSSNQSEISARASATQLRLGGNCLGIIWEHLDGLRRRRLLGDIWRSDLRNPNTSQRKCKSSI